VWLIGLGRDAFERAVANPDNLASLPEVLRLAGRPVDGWSPDDWPDWASLSYVAWEAYEQVTGENEGLYDAMEARKATTAPQTQTPPASAGTSRTRPTPHSGFPGSAGSSPSPIEPPEISVAVKPLRAC
jgi:hypothetical protein